MAKQAKSNASPSVSRAAIGDTGNNDNPPNTSVNGTATPNMEDGVATTPDMPQAWPDTSMEVDLEEYAKTMERSVTYKDGKVVPEEKLNEQRPIDVANALQSTSLKSYKTFLKPLKYTLNADGMYEADCLFLLDHRP